VPTGLRDAGLTIPLSVVKTDTAVHPSVRVNENETHDVKV
jgi:hypothetical protein